MKHKNYAYSIFQVLKLMHKLFFYLFWASIKLKNFENYSDQLRKIITNDLYNTSSKDWNKFKFKIVYL